MRILADSNVFINFWRKSDQDMINIFSNEDIVICGIVRSELMHGAKSASDLKNICELLDEFEELSFEDSDWSSLGKYLYILRTNGITVPFQDAIIATLAIKFGLPLWTDDRHFFHIQRVLKDLQLLNRRSDD